MSLVAQLEHELSLLSDGEPRRDAGDDEQAHPCDGEKLFANEGHSGFSAAYASGILEKLLRYEPITPLTGADDEWNDVSHMGPNPLWQNRRCSRVFKEADGRAYDVEGKIFREPDGCWYAKKESHVYIEFPAAGQNGNTLMFRPQGRQPDVRLKTARGATRFVIITRRRAYKFPRLLSWRHFLWGLLANMQERQFGRTGWPELLSRALVVAGRLPCGHAARRGLRRG